LCRSSEYHLLMGYNRMYSRQNFFARSKPGVDDDYIRLTKKIL